MPKLDGAILAGGESRRMGRDKALLPLGGLALVDRVRAALRPVVERVRLIGDANRHPGISPNDIQPDLLPGLGPLSGIHAALATSGYEAVLVVACDLPFLTTRFLRGLAERLVPTVDAVVPVGKRGPVPVCALYRTGSLPALEARLSRRELSATAFVLSLDVRTVEADELHELDPEGTCLVNLNTPADYERARALLENGASGLESERK